MNLGIICPPDANFNLLSVLTKVQLYPYFALCSMGWNQVTVEKGRDWPSYWWRHLKPCHPIGSNRVINQIYVFNSSVLHAPCLYEPIKLGIYPDYVILKIGDFFVNKYKMALFDCVSLFGISYQIDVIYWLEKGKYLWSLLLINL